MGDVMTRANDDKTSALRGDDGDGGDELPALHLTERAARDLGFLEVGALLAASCKTPFGREVLAEEPFPTSRAVVEERLEEALEARAAVERKVAPDFGSLRDVRAVLDAVDKGVVLGANDILDVAKTVDALARLHDVVTFQGAEAPRLSALGAEIDDDRRFARRVFRSFDEQGQLTDDASPELAALRSKVRALRAEAQEQLGSLVRELDDAGILRDRNFTVRNDRYVLPVKSEFQGRVEGIVHDASQTHQTVFVEPRALLQLGNRIKIARADVEQEEQRILRELSLEVGELSHRLFVDLGRAGRIEAAFARGAFAARVDGKRARVRPPSSRATLSLIRARHPLLEHLRAEALAEGRPSGPVIGNDIAFGGARALVISGPNAGGKTVALRTAGLVALLARAGIPAPVEEQSVIPAFAAVCCSIGDAQSLEGGYSSFSGSLVVLRGILEEIEQNRGRGPVLCLLDELLSGTDPAQGAALAQATLEHVVERGALVVATTHYERLKVLGIVDEEHKSFRNAAVALDPHGRPTFHVVLDQAGTSNALEAARRYGLPESIIERSSALLSPDEKELQAVLRTLAEQKGLLEAKLAEAEAAKARIEAESQKLERKLADVEREAARLRKEGKRAFLDEIKEARKVVAEAIEATKGGDARALNKASQSLAEMESHTRADVEAPPPRAELTRPASVKVGDVVELATLPGSRVTVMEIDGDNVLVARGAMKMRATLDQLRSPDKSPDEKPAKAKGTSVSTAPTPAGPAGTAAEPRTSDNTLDVRGRRADEALELVDAFLDRMLRDGRSRAYILHGHGSGALKKALRAALQNHSVVGRAFPADPDEGGDSWTVVSLA
jgi:DNA mismatch repair protein MutS2